jgi:hypothetical protein
MELNLSPELQAKLAHIAAQNNSGAEEYVLQLVEHYLAGSRSFRVFQQMKSCGRILPA